MKSYIFITTEGYTFQPESNMNEPDIENCQVIGFAKGKNEKGAFDNLVNENEHLLESLFDELICFELKHDNNLKHKSYFYLSDIKQNATNST